VGCGVEVCGPIGVSRRTIWGGSAVSKAIGIADVARDLGVCRSWGSPSLLILGGLGSSDVTNPGGCVLPGSAGARSPACLDVPMATVIEACRAARKQE